MYSNSTTRSALELPISKYFEDIFMIKKKLIICEAIYKTVTCVRKQNFVLEPKICDGVENANFQILMETCSTCIQQPCTVQIYSRRCVLHRSILWRLDA